MSTPAPPLTDHLADVRATDYFFVREQLSDAQLDALRRVCGPVDDEVLPVIAGYWERAEMPWSLIRRIGELGIVGGDIEGHGCPGLDPIACGLVRMELHRGDGSLSTFLGVHAGLAMKSIAMLGSEEQTQDWLPGMARLEKLGAFGLTEPNHGSDSVALETTARLNGDQFVIKGAKRLGVEPLRAGGARFHEEPVDLAVLAARPDDDDVGQAAVADPDIRVFPRVLGMPGGAPLAGPGAATDCGVDQQAEGGCHRSLFRTAKRLTKLDRLRVGRIVHRTYRRFPMAVLDHFRLDGKVAVVTGASSGLGFAFAVALAEAGANVALGARRVDRLTETAMLVEAAGRRSLAVATDVSDPDACTVLVESAMSEFGQVDVLVNNAGVGTAYPATRETPEQFREVVDINLNGSYWMAQACARVMQPGSAIINIGSVMGFTTGELPQAAYCSTKAAIVGLTRDLAQQWSGRKGIRVNALAPGFFASEMTDHYPEGYMERMIEQRVPMKRAGEAEELCTALIFLASDAGSYVNGITLPVDGGLLTT